MTSNRLIFCTTCGGQSDETDECSAGRAFGADVEQALKSAGLSEEFSVGYVACMGACVEPVSMAVQGKGRATYLFAGLNPVVDVADVIATCQTYLNAPDGWIEDARPCGRLRHCLRARVPRFDP